MRCRTLSRALVPALALAVSLAGAARAADRLGSLPIDPAQISVSGISSGAFMANQLHVAHSASLMGAGLVAGGLYGCAVFDATEVGVQPMTSLALGPCMTAPSLLQPAATYADRIAQFAALGWIDPVENLGRSRLYAFTGRADAVVNPETVRRAVAVYGLLGLPTVATSFSNTAVNAGHSWVTQAYGVACADNKTPYINDCHYDQARFVLETIYGKLAPARGEAHRPVRQPSTRRSSPRTATGRGTGCGIPACSMSRPPARRRPPPPCRLHVVLHGCKQSEQALGDRFYRHVGVNEWADTNRIVVLYPQARTVSTTAFNPPRLHRWQQHQSGRLLELVGLWLRQALPVQGRRPGQRDLVDGRAGGRAEELARHAARRERGRLAIALRLGPAAPFPGRHPFRLGQRPEAAPGGTGLGLQHRQLRVVVVAVVDPGGAAANHLGIHVAVAGIDMADNPAVAVGILDHHPHLALEGEVGQRLPRPAAIGLAALGRVDLRQPDLGLAMVGGQQGEGVAIGDADDLADELGCRERGQDLEAGEKGQSGQAAHARYSKVASLTNMPLRSLNAKRLT